MQAREWWPSQRTASSLRIAPGRATSPPRKWSWPTSASATPCVASGTTDRNAGEGMVAVAAYRELIADSARPRYFASAQVELAYFGLGDSLRGQRHYDEAAQAYERVASTPNVGPELKIRSLLDAGECRDMNGERPQAVTDYQAAIAAGPNTEEHRV